MAPFLRKIARRLLIILHLISAALFLLACCNAFLPPDKWWFIALLGLGFPALLLIILAFLVLWVIFRSGWALLSLACLLLGYPNIRALVGIHFSSFTQKKQEQDLRVLTWNVTWFDEQTKSDRRSPRYRKEMLEYIRKQDADILCFQEYVEPNTSRKPYNNRADITALGYPYSYVAIDYIGWKNTYQSGVAIFSRYPIVDTMRIRYPGPRRLRADESLIGADIVRGGDTIRVFTTHLQSVLFQQDDYRHLELIRSASDSMLEASRSVIRKLTLAYRFRRQQVDLVRETLESSPYPTLLCGDFNDIPNSYTYFRLRGPRQDAFREAGAGIGRTFAHLSPTLRIDYIFCDERFRVRQYKRDLVPYSEHYPILADLRLENTDN